jgi:hypothetical protein
MSRRSRREVRPLDSALAPLYSQRFHLIRAVHDTSRVNEQKRHPSQVHDLLQCVTSCAGDGRDDGPALAQQPVEQARLAHIGAAHDSRPHALTIHDARVRTLDKLPQRRARVLQDPADVLLLNLVLGEVNSGGEIGEDVHQGSTHLPNLFREPPAETVHGQAEPGPSLRLDNIKDRLGLREVHPAVQERPQRELAGIGQPGPAEQDHLEDALQGHRPAVAVDLDDVLSGVGVRSLHVGRQHLISHDPDPALADGGGYCSDRILVHGAKV